MLAFVHTVDRLLGYCSTVFHWIANTCLAVLLVINVANIAKGAILDTRIPWVFPWSVVIFVWMIFFGFFVLYRLRRDITVDFVVERLGPRARFASRMLVNLIIFVLMSILLWHAPEILARQVGVIEMLPIQRYTMSVPLFLSAALIMINYIVDTIEAFVGEPEPEHKMLDGM